MPAYDRFFRVGFGVTTFGRKSLAALDEYYPGQRRDDRPLPRPHPRFTTGAETARAYTRAKVIDMVFFIECAGLGASPPNEVVS